MSESYPEHLIELDNIWEDGTFTVIQHRIKGRAGFILKEGWLDEPADRPEWPDQEHYQVIYPQQAQEIVVGNKRMLIAHEGFPPDDDAPPRAQIEFYDGTADNKRRLVDDGFTVYMSPLDQ